MEGPASILPGAHFIVRTTLTFAHRCAPKPKLPKLNGLVPLVKGYVFGILYEQEQMMNYQPFLKDTFTLFTCGGNPRAALATKHAIAQLDQAGQFLPRWHTYRNVEKQTVISSIRNWTLRYWTLIWTQKTDKNIYRLFSTLKFKEKI